MSVKYDFVKVCVAHFLDLEIKSSNIVTALDYINVSQTGTEVWFKAALSSADETTLNSLVAAHDPTQTIEPQVQSVVVAETVPFAKPDFRTKRNGTTSWVACPENENTVLDFVLSEELYVTGGELIVLNGKKGDYITAEVRDIYSSIPESLRAALCENWPTVALYVVKHWIQPGDHKISINTYPLNAKITEGLSLRVTYHSSAETGTRDVAINYYLTKKL